MSSPGLAPLPSGRHQELVEPALHRRGRFAGGSRCRRVEVPAQSLCRALVGRKEAVHPASRRGGHMPRSTKASIDQSNGGSAREPRYVIDLDVVEMDGGDVPDRLWRDRLAVRFAPDVAEGQYVAGGVTPDASQHRELVRRHVEEVAHSDDASAVERTARRR